MERRRSYTTLTDVAHLDRGRLRPVQHETARRSSASVRHAPALPSLWSPSPGSVAPLVHSDHERRRAVARAAAAGGQQEGF